MCRSCIHHPIKCHYIRQQDMATFRRLISVTICTLLLYGCTQKEIVFPDSELATIAVNFEWGHASGAEVEGMTLYMFSTDEHGKVWRFDIPGKDGGLIELPIGNYRMIAYNNDLPGIKVSDINSFSTIKAGARLWQDSTTFRSTGMLYGSVISDIRVTFCGVAYRTGNDIIKECPKGLIRCTPDSLATQYTVSITDVSGIEHVRNAAVYLASSASDIALSDWMPSNFESRLSFQLDADKEAATLTGSGCAFNYQDGRMEPYIISLIITLDNGKTLIKTISLKSESINLMSRHNVIINVTDIDIPDDGDTPPEDVGDMNVTVDGWDVIVIDVVNNRFS